MPTTPRPSPSSTASARRRAALPTLLLSLLLCACGSDPAPPAQAQRAGAEAEAAEQELAEAMALDDPLARQLAVLRAVTESRGFSDARVAEVCEAELGSRVLLERCQRFLERTHLRRPSPATPPAPASTEIPQVEVCSESAGVGRDLCLSEQLLDLATAPVEELATLAAAIADLDQRGQAICAALAAEGQPGDPARLAGLRALAELAPGHWGAEAWSLLGSELPFRLDRQCRAASSGSTRCEAALGDTLLPAAAAGCAQAGTLALQCFDHLCAAMAELAVAEAGHEPAAFFAATLHARLGQALALDRRVAAQPQCQAVWAGRKASQALADAEAAARLCGGLLEEERGPCLSGLAEEQLRAWLRLRPVAGERELLRLVQSPDGELEAATPGALQPYLPCAAFSILNFDLEASLSAQRLSEEELLELRDARADCAWSQVPPASPAPPQRSDRAP